MLDKKIVETVKEYHQNKPKVITDAKNDLIFKGFNILIYSYAWICAMWFDPMTANTEIKILIALLRAKIGFLQYCIFSFILTHKTYTVLQCEFSKVVSVITMSLDEKKNYSVTHTQTVSVI